MSKEKTALYGIGIETEKNLPKLKELYEIVGLLDGFKDDGEIYGYPIISINTAVNEKISLIIVIARPGSCKAIAKRIGAVCRENNIKLFDIRGNDLLAESKVVYDFNNIKGYQKDELISEIKSSDIVSFDLFDTLIVRNVVSSIDVIDIVNSHLLEKGIVINDFSRKRLGAEKSLSIGKSPKLTEIYNELLRNDGNSEITSSELANLEFSIDQSLVQPRKEMVSLIKTVQENGKKVFVTSDTYYTKQQIENILSNNGIDYVDEVIVSCEYNTSKTDNLFEKLKEKTTADNILHIGDDFSADIESAEKHGIKSFKIYSPLELLDMLGGLNLNEHINSVSDRIKAGMFIAEIFNSPFQFEADDKRITVNNSESIGYLFIAPMILDFTKWFGEQIKENYIQNIWFGARDGYLIQKIYELLYPDEKTEYFLTSRISAIRAGIFNESDISYVDSMKFSGNLKDNLKVRFGIESDEDIDETQTGLLKYAKVIIEKSSEKRDNYLRYIKKLKIKEGNIAFFDFVAKGTTQMYVQKLIQNQIVGLYFLQLEPEFMKKNNVNIKPFYSEKERETSEIFNNYYVIETILTSPFPSVEEFDENGNAIYSGESRKKSDIDCFMRVQCGIVSYIKKYLSICPDREFKINKKIDERFLALIHNVNIKDVDFMNLTIEDPFFNRMTDITDII